MENEMGKFENVRDDSGQRRARKRHTAQDWIEGLRGASTFPPGVGDWIYFIKEWGGAGRIKVGYSRNVKKRLGALQTGTSADLFVAGWTAGTKATERKLHAALESYHARGEWYHAGPRVLDLVLAIHGLKELDVAALDAKLRGCLTRTPVSRAPSHWGGGER